MVVSHSRTLNDFSVRQLISFHIPKFGVDFVIVYEEEKLSEKQLQKKEKEAAVRREKGLPATEEEIEAEKQEGWRKKYLQNITEAGLVVEEDAVETEKKVIVYYKLHAPWQCMVFFAEELGLKAPLQVRVFFFFLVCMDPNTNSFPFFN